MARTPQDITDAELAVLQVLHLAKCLEATTEGYGKIPIMPGANGMSRRKERNRFLAKRDLLC